VHDETREYFLPYPYDAVFLMVQGNNGIGDICPACSHYGQYALDFAMEPGSPVVAARAGIVDSVRDTCPDVNCPWSGGETPDCCGNFVKILHEDGTTGRYWHLMPQGVLVEPGNQVARGDLLGLSGNTGISMLPHLHFSVRVDAASAACGEMGCPAGHGCGAFGCSEDASTEVAFADVCDNGVPQLGWTYTSRNEEPPGSP
jgi:murein DD-endopeptidase MepM/ murein hydrolase activator NlpD